MNSSALKAMGDPEDDEDDDDEEEEEEEDEEETWRVSTRRKELRCCATGD